MPLKRHMKNDYHDFRVNESSYKKLIVLYDDAIKKEQETFMFEKHELLTVYAKYLIEHLASRFK